MKRIKPQEMQLNGSNNVCSISSLTVGVTYRAVVDVHIGQIRKKIKEVEINAPEFIKTVRSYGYKFEPELD